MNKHSEMAKITKDNFIYAFIKLNKEKPIEKISIKELTEIAGYNRTTFYNYFTDVYNLYQYIESCLFENIKMQLEENMRNTSGKDNFINNVISICTNWSDYLAVVLKNPYSYHFTSKVKTALLSYWASHFNISESNIKELYTLDFYLSASISLISRWINNEEDMTIEDLAALLYELVDNSVLDKLLICK